MTIEKIDIKVIVSFTYRYYEVESLFLSELYLLQ